MPFLSRTVAVAAFLATGLVNASAADTPPAAVAPANPPPAKTMTYGDAVVLGVVEGLTEYLPVSSTGHLVVAQHVLKLDAETPLLDAQGQPILATHHGETQPLTLKTAVDNYNIIIHRGAILAVLFLYWGDVLSLLRGAMGRNPKGLLALRNLLVAFMPSAVLGLLIEQWIEEHLFSSVTVAVAFVVGAVVMLWAERWRKTRERAQPTAPDLAIHDLSWQQALFIGTCQCWSLCPGMSRSMTTIVGGYFAGMRPARAAEFSFLLGLLTLTAASGYKAVGHYAELRAALPPGPLLVGIAVATVSAFAAVKWFVGWLSRNGMGAFAWYRFVAASVILWLMR